MAFLAKKTAKFINIIFFLVIVFFHIPSPVFSKKTKEEALTGQKKIDPKKKVSSKKKTTKSLLTSQKLIGKTFVESIAVEEIEKSSVITIHTNQKCTFVDFILFKPSRLIVDLMGNNIFSKRQQVELINATLLKKIIMGYFIKDILGKKEEKKVDYISFLLSQNFSHTIKQKDKNIIITVSPVGTKKKLPISPKDLEKAMHTDALKKNSTLQGTPQETIQDSSEEKEINKKKNAKEGLSQKNGKEKKDLKNQEVFDSIQTKHPDINNSFDKNDKKEQPPPNEKIKEKSAINEVEKKKSAPNKDEKEKKISSQEKKIPDHLEKQEETGLIVPKQKDKLINIIKKVRKRQKNILFFEKSNNDFNQSKESKKKIKKKMKRIIKEMKKYTPLIQPDVKELSLEECIQIALNNHLPAKISLEKIKLSKLKYWEARRNLFPRLTTDLNKTRGETEGEESPMPFREKNYKITLDHNLFDGGAVKFLLEQSKINLEIAKKTYNKIKSELSFEISEAYYNLVMAQMNMATQRCLFEDVKTILTKIQYLYEKKLIREIDMRNIKASYHQIQYQLSGTLKDYKMGELSLRQKMNIDQDVPLKIIESIGFKDVDINLKDALWLGYKYRPDYLINKLMVQFKNYDRLANMAKQHFMIDFSGSYGYGGSAYEEKTLKLDKQWNASIKVSKIFGGSTLETNVIREETFPRLGQSSRGKSYTRSLKFSLLDNLKTFTTKKQSDISFQEALLEVGKIEKQIETDIRNAYYDYQKAIIQIDSAFDKILFRQKELKVNEVTSLYGDGNFLQLVDSHVRLADEKSFYYQGLVNYYVAIANMNKGIGLIGYY